MIENLVKKQREYFKSGKTLDVNMRVEYLKKLKAVIKRDQKKVANALYEDLGKSSTEAYMCEIGMVLEELSTHIKNVKSWAKREKKSSPLAQFPSKSFRLPSPYGNVLIISPWNYPFLLSLQPLIGAVGAGNTVLLKPSRASVSTSKIIKEIVEEVFPDAYVACVYEGDSLNEEILTYKFDYIFFTGGKSVGKTVYKSASENLTPVTLELGGKSPAVIDKTAKIELSAKRVAFGKFLNAGQTCVAPDYVIAHKDIADEFVACLKKQISVLYPDPLNNKDYGKIINARHFERVKNLLNANVVYGGKYDESARKIEPTVIFPASEHDEAMQEEIFGPVLPVLTYSTDEELLEIIERNPTPLAFYLFTRDNKLQKKILNSVQFGGGCVNDTVIHLASKLPFGGVGNSGIGSYHGEQSFYTFSHFKSVLKKSNSIDLPMRYSPYKKFHDKLIRFFMK